MKTRSAAAIASLGFLLAMPAGALAGGSTTTSSQITSTPPPRLTTTTPSLTTTTPTVTGPSGGATTPSGTLPSTGYDLLPETLLGIALVGVGVGLKLRRAGA